MYHKCRLIHADLNEYNLLYHDKQVEAELDKIQERLAQQELSITLNEDIDKMSKDLVDEEVFKKAFIPRTLNDVFDVERDTLKVSKDEGEDLIYRRLTGLSIDDKAEKIPNENEVMKQSRGKQNEDKESKKRAEESCERSGGRKKKESKAVKMLSEWFNVVNYK
ncbi:unnamed protein product [Rhizophagus irregularis]|nr:unnamed protein product [Rhizophagus irregularis]